MAESDEKYSKDLEDRIEELEKLIDLEFVRSKSRVQTEAMAVWKLAFQRLSNIAGGVHSSQVKECLEKAVNTSNMVADKFIEHFKDK